MALMSVAVISMLVAGFLQVSSSVTRRQSGSSDAKQAFYLAEAGLAEAYTGLAVAHTGNVGTEAQPAAFGDGMFWVEATRTGDLVTLRSTGVYGSGRAALGIVVEPVERSLSELGIFVSDNLRVNPDTKLDSFDSAIGSYADQVGTKSNNKALVGSNGDVDLNSGDVVYGDVRSGPTGSVSLGGAIVTGDTGAAPAAQPLPPIDVPPIPVGPARDEDGAFPVVIGPGEFGYTSLSVGGGSKVVVKGPTTLVVGDISLAKDSEIHFDTTDGPVDVYVTEDLDLKGDSLVSCSSEVTSDVIFMVSSPSSRAVSFGSDATFYGFIYAPNAEVKMSSKFEVFGGLVAKGLNLAAQGRMHYDLSLDPSRNGILPKYYSWRVVDIPNSLRAKHPSLTSGVDRSTLPMPGQAHEDQLLELEYLSASGTRSSFTGKESTFDWHNVDEVLAGKRDGVPFESPGENESRHEGSDPNLDIIADPNVSSMDLRDLLCASLPLSNEVLIAATEREPPMTPADLKVVLLDMGPSNGNPPLDADVLFAAIESAGLDSSNLKAVLIDSSPLPPPVLQAAIDRVPAMKNGDLNGLLNQQ